MSFRSHSVLRTWLALFALLLVAGACSAGIDSSSGPTQGEFDELLEGRLTDPEEFQLEVVSCFNDGEFIQFSWGITNLSDSRKTYAFDPYLVRLDGLDEKQLRELVGGSVGPGEYMEWESSAGGGELFPLGDEIECRFEVVDSPLGAFRDE